MVETTQLDEVKQDAQVLSQEKDSEEGEGSGSGGSTAGKLSPRNKKRLKRHVTDVIVYVHARFNNTLITITDGKGNVLSSATAGGSGFRGSRKRTPYPGQIAANKAILKVKELYGAEYALILIEGPGPGRDSAIRVVKDNLGLTGIYDITRIPHNGCRPEKRRRV